MSHRSAVTLMLLVTLLWSIAGVVTRHLETADSFAVTFWRSLFNALALGGVLTLRRGSGLWIGLTRAPWPVWFSGACWAVMFTAFMIALTLTSVANVLLTMAIGPLITALFTRLFLHHRLPARTWFAIAIAGMGIAWMFGHDTQGNTSTGGTLVALAVPLAAALNFTTLQYAGLRSADKRADQRQGHDMLPAVLIGAIVSSLCMLPLAHPLQASAHDLALLAILGVFQLAIPCLLLVRVSQVLPAAEIALLGLLEVIFGVTWAWLGAGETPAMTTLAGGALVLAALLSNEALPLLGGRARRLPAPAPSSSHLLRQPGENNDVRQHSR